MDRAAAVVREKVGDSAFDRITGTNPARVLKDLPLETIDVGAYRRKPGKKKIWRLWQ